ncbi:hypothetical protein ACFIJ5_05985 [Haloimpatiens sp. FM7330]|uniref:hypothetical protein n=1 Tax=Haloimpatiens sp. FM7330 TaxID=3298610 RepID=UPI00364353CE
MKRFFRSILVIVVLVIVTLSFDKFYKSDNFKLKYIDKKIDNNIMFKGLNGAVDFTVDNEKNYYIAYKNKIQVINKNGKSYNLILNKNLDISSIELYGKTLYYISGCRLYCYDIASKKEKCLINNIPNFGDYKNSKIKRKDNYLYITIGSSTNSGIVGKDNEWIKEKPYNFDISPKTIILKGMNFGAQKSGAFVSYGTPNIKGQIIPGHFPGNASIIIYNLKSGAYETYSWGIRNVQGLDFNSEKKLFAIVGGMENRGLRSIKGDVDYIYEIKKDIWYGWPDYSGGDPITSPRFKDKNDKKIQFILDKHPCTNPPAPVYQHKEVSSLEHLAIDKKGVLGSKDCMYFYSNLDNKLYSLDKKGILKQKVIFNKNCNIVGIKFFGDNIFSLDASNGFLYQFKAKSTNEFKGDFNKIIMYYMLIILVVLITIILVFQNHSKKETIK